MLAFEIIISVWVSVSKKIMDIKFHVFEIIIEWYDWHWWRCIYADNENDGHRSE